MVPIVPLFPAPPAVHRACARIQAGVRFPVLCPTRLPHPTRGWHADDPLPPLHVDVFGDPRRPRLATPYGLEVGYSAPVEPTSGPGWTRLLWHNRPCCFLHFTLFVPRGAPLPPMRPARLGGKDGAIRYATGYGLRRTPGIYWANHTWFAWRSTGVRWVASLHFGGRGTTRLLARIVRSLRPVRGG
jgi:hypothetical protein